MPPPACGGHPYRKASRYDAIFSRSATNQTDRRSATDLECQLKKRLTDVVVLGPLGQKVRVVDPLRPGQNFLPAHEHVVRVAPLLQKQNNRSFKNCNFKLLLKKGQKRQSGLELWAHDNVVEDKHKSLKSFNFWTISSSF